LSGWIKLHRKSIKNPAFKKPLTWHYWQYCLLKANHEPNKIIWNNKDFTVDTGSFITGRKIAAKETGLSEQNIRTAIKTLVNLKMIEISTTKSTSKFSYVTVCKYKEYQLQNSSSNHQINQQVTSNQPATNQQPTTNKNDKNEKNEKKKTVDSKIIFNRETWTFENITQDQVNRWKQAFPLIDIWTEILRAGMWLESKNQAPNNRASEFLFNWFKKAKPEIQESEDKPDSYYCT
jgi:hypothetical protein